MTPAMALWPGASARGVRAAPQETAAPCWQALGGSFSPRVRNASLLYEPRPGKKEDSTLRPFFLPANIASFGSWPRRRRAAPDAARHDATTGARDYWHAGPGLDAAPARVESRRAPQWLHPCVGGTTAEGGGRTSEEQCVVRGKVLRPTVRLPSRPLQLRGAAAGHATTEQPQVGQPDSAPVRAVHCLRHHTRLGAVRTHHGAWAGL